MVTLGFRCSPELKLSLSKLAQKEKKTLSQYVNELTINAENTYKGLLEKISVLELEKTTLEKRISNYETTELKTLFHKCKGKKATIKDSNGDSKEIVVNTILDLHEVITKSFNSR
jgi:hypothetical protein